MKHFLPAFLIASLLLAACAKEYSDLPVSPTPEPCITQTDNPSGRSYATDSVIAYNCTSKHCGFIPLSTRNYWIYEDSVYTDGVFQRVQYDTLRFRTTRKSLSDGLVWWEGNINIGLPERMYANDSALYRLQDRIFIQGIMDAKKDFSLFPGDSVRYLTSFDDVAANGRSVKLSSPVKSPAGTFSGCIYFEKNSRNYRKDQVYFKPGIGVLRYVHEMATPGSPFIKLQQVSNLVAYHIE